MPDKIKRIQSIRIITRWPVRMSSAVPNRISYSPTTNGRRQWGYDIDDDSDVHDSLRLHLEDGSRYEELVHLRNLVLEATRNSDLDESAPPFLYKSPEIIASDYLQKIAEHFRDEFGRVYSPWVLENVPLDLVVSYPSVSLLDRE